MVKTDNIKRILIIFWDRIGEVIVSSNILQSLKGLNGNIHITCICGKNGMQVLKNNPYVDEFIQIDEFILSVICKKRPYDLTIDFFYRRISKLIVSLSRARYTIWFHSTGGLLAYKNLDTLALDGISDKDERLLKDCYYFNKGSNDYLIMEDVSLRQRVKLNLLFNYPHLRYLGGPFFRQVRPDPSETKRIPLSRNHGILDIFDAITRYLGGRLEVESFPKLYLATTERRFADGLLKTMGIKENGSTLIGIHPGTTSKREIWPAIKYASLAKGLLKAYNAKMLIFQGPGEEETARKIYNLISGSRDIICVPFLKLREYISVVSKCDFFITNDGGPMHIAAALDVPFVGIFINGRPDYWFPYYRRNRCDFVSCDKNGIPVRLVLEKIANLLK